MHLFEFFVERVATPVGEMLVVTDAFDVLRAVDWHDYEDQMAVLLRRQYPGSSVTMRTHPFRSTATQGLQDYFEGDIAAIDALHVGMGGTAFQQSVWRELRKIRAGETITYGVLASRIGRPKAVRVAGGANGANVIDIVVPFHRVIGANASLTGYGGGLHSKNWLLDHERKWSASRPALL